ncbi:MAG TPA: YncE family protein [Gemmatimonadales bacterium]|nr:YncE family protein [Gemmatimonadales bacterium]
MPPLRLTSLLQTALPHLSESGRALLRALGCLNGHPPRPKELAEWLGFHNRYQLARALRRDGLPPLEVIGGWARTLYWMIEAETSGLSLRELAEREHVDPAVAYRLVRRVTGHRWSEVRRDGLALAVLHFRDRCANGKAQAAKLSQPLALAVGDRTTRQPARPMLTRSANVVTRPTPQHTPGHRVVQTVAERLPVGGAPFDLALTARGALVTRSHAAALDVLQLDPLRVAHTIRVGPAPTRVIPGGRSQWAYVTSQFAEAVCIIDLERQQQVGLIPVPGDPMGAVMSPDAVTLYATTNQDRLVAISSLQRVAVGYTPIPLACPQVTVHPSGRFVYVPCWRAGVVVEVDTSTLETRRRFDIGGIAQDVIVSSDGQSLYVANQSGWLDVVHLPSGRRAATVEFGTPAFGVALSPDEQFVFVGLLDAGRIVVLQRHGLIERATIATGGRPRMMAVHPRGDRVLVANEAGWVDLLR